MQRITVLKIKELNTLVIRKNNSDDDFFTTTGDSIIIEVFNFSALIKFLLFREIISPKLLQGIVDEYMSFKEH